MAGVRTWLRGGRGFAVLIASLILNVFLLAVVAGSLVMQVASEERAGDFGRPGLAVEAHAFAAALPEEERQAFRTQMRALGPDLRAHWQRLRSLREEIAALIAEPEPDREAIDARLAEIRATTSEMQKLVQSQAFDAILALPPELRRDLEIDFKNLRRERNSRR